MAAWSVRTGSNVTNAWRKLATTSTSPSGGSSTSDAARPCAIAQAPSGSAAGSTSSPASPYSRTTVLLTGGPRRGCGPAVWTQTATTRRQDVSRVPNRQGSRPGGGSRPGLEDLRERGDRDPGLLE